MSMSIRLPLRVVRPLVGFEGLARLDLVWANHAVFDLREFDPDAPSSFALPRPGGSRLRHDSTFELRSPDNPDLGFLAHAGDSLLPEYLRLVAEGTPAALAAELDLQDWDDALALVLIHQSRRSGLIEANLLAPVVVNVRSRLVSQVILTGSDLPIHAEIV